jgi:hypothetical protein
MTNATMPRAVKMRPIANMMSASTLAAVRRRSEGTDRLGEDALAQVTV